MKRVNWPAAVVIVALLACVTALSLFGSDNTALVTIGLAVMTALGFVGAQGQAVKEQTNGNTSQLVELVRELAHRGYDAIPVTPSTVPPMVPAVEAPAPLSTSVDTLPAWPPTIPTQRTDPEP
jgi:ABC-type sugar transport system substrate-binding protein